MTKSTVYTLISLFIIFLVVVIVDFKLSKEIVEESLVTNFEECKNAGYPIMESYPEQCRDANGNLFVRVIEPEVKPTEDIKDISNPILNNKEFNKSLTLKINEQATFSGNMTVTLKEINDSRCKPDVQCIWAGELSVLLSVLFPTINPAQDVRLGTTNNKSITMHGYTFTLQSATENTATIIVSNRNR